jgi:hypothetical protein
MAISWTTTEQKEAGGAREERLEGIPEPMRMCTGEPSIADMLEDKSPKIKDCMKIETYDQILIQCKVKCVALVAHLTGGDQ